MNINLTLVGQMITFAILVWVTMHFVWPPILDAMKERRERIAQGEAAAEAAHASLRDAETEAHTLLSKANTQKEGILTDAKASAKELLAQAKTDAKVAAERLAEQAKAKRDQQAQALSDGVRAQWSSLVVQAAEALLRDQVDEKKSEQLVEKWLSEHE